MSLDEKILEALASHRRRNLGSLCRAAGADGPTVLAVLSRMVEAGILTQGISQGVMVYRRAADAAPSGRSYVPSYEVAQMRRHWAGTPWQGLENLL